MLEGAREGRERGAPLLEGKEWEMNGADRLRTMRVSRSRAIRRTVNERSVFSSLDTTVRILRAI